MKNSEVPRMALRRAVQLCNGVNALAQVLYARRQPGRPQGAAALTVRARQLRA